MMILTFFSFQNTFSAKGRAPLEPYYGRYIGPFTEFAHKIKVQLKAKKKKTISLNVLSVAIVTNTQKIML